MRKRLLSVIMAAAMVMTLAGCEKGTQQEEAQQAGANAQESATLEEVKGDDEAAGVAEVDPAVVEQILGVYEDSISQRASLEVKHNDDGTFYIELYWGTSAFEANIWKMNATFDPATNRLEYKDCTEIVQTYSETEETKVEVVYENGEGYFEVDGDLLRWTGAQDEYCRECIFVKGQYDGELEEPYVNDFLQSRTGTFEFDSYDAIIDQLKDGEGYAYIELTGYEGKLLIITDAIYEYEDGILATIAGSVYEMKDGKAIQIGNAFTNGTAYPLRCDGKLLYVTGHHEYEEMFVGKEYDGLMVKRSIVENFDEEGNPEYWGFERETNSYEAENKDVVIENQDQFYALFDEWEKVPVINFVEIGK